ncbi:MAG: hypothetical protein MMC23_006818 [Stictis urceolatum]|nr:hypothetical protein [Stictis urceolata]
MSPINDLPAELQLQLLEDHVSGGSLLALSGTNWYWHATIDERKHELLDNIIERDFAFEDEFFRQLSSPSEPFLKRAIAAILETELFENGQLEKGTLQKQFLSKQPTSLPDLLDQAPWDAPFLRPGLMVLPFNRFDFVSASQPGVFASCQYSSYTRPHFEEFQTLVDSIHSKILTERYSYLSFLITFQKRLRKAVETAAEYFNWRQGTESLTEWVLHHFISAIQSNRLQQTPMTFALGNLMNALLAANRPQVALIAGFNFTTFDFTGYFASLFNAGNSFPLSATEYQKARYMVQSLFEYLREQHPIHAWYGYIQGPQLLGRSGIANRLEFIERYYLRDFEPQSLDFRHTKPPQSAFEAIFELSQRIRDHCFDLPPNMLRIESAEDEYNLFSTHAKSFRHSGLSLYFREPKIASEDDMLPNLFDEA